MSTIILSQATQAEQSSEPIDAARPPFRNIFVDGNDNDENNNVKNNTIR